MAFGVDMLVPLETEVAVSLALLVEVRLAPLATRYLTHPQNDLLWHPAE
jgi:hypothetical protein